MFTATIRHHSIKRVRSIDVGNNLNVAKRLATREFRADNQDYHIVILDDAGQLVSGRRIADEKWQDSK